MKYLAYRMQEKVAPTEAMKPTEREIMAIAYCHGDTNDLLDYDDAYTEGLLIWDLPGSPGKFARLGNRHEVIVGFQSQLNTDLVLWANGVGLTTHYDLFAELQKQEAACDLKDLAKANGLKLEDLSDEVLGLQRLLVLGLQGTLKLPDSGRQVQLPSLEEVRLQLAC